MEQGGTAANIVPLVDYRDNLEAVGTDNTLPIRLYCDNQASARSER
jgi:hypothetical protein